jgi:hypothetical protein
VKKLLAASVIWIVVVAACTPTAKQEDHPDGWMFGPQRWDQGALAPDQREPICPNGIYDAPGGNLRQC